MNNAQYISQQVDSEQEKQVIQDAQEDRNNDESKDRDYDNNDTIELEVDETMNEVFGALYDRHFSSNFTCWQIL